MKNLPTIIFVILFILSTFSSNAGWVITQRHSTDEGLIQYETLTIQSNLVKISGLNGTFIFDIGKGTFVLANEQRKVFWEGRIDEFRSSYYAALKSIIEELTKDLPQDQKDLYNTMLEETINMYAETKQPANDSTKTEIKNTGLTEEIAGYSSSGFEVYVNGKLREQLWISSAIPLKKDLDMREFASIIREIEPNVNGEYVFENSESYLKLTESGFPMRTIDDLGIMVEVIKVEEQKIANSEFEMPADFKRAGLDEIIRLAMIGAAGEDKEEDSWE
jgi:hypothetical protein